ncbi:unnamed protein product [Dovyalis caffra]|uniref:Uncharacterized protein n=1 Tax=Dovyalis caffra TaxID=77055 RepID=A0AAV1SE00_9ROSI|nr:unnamed protein product [Dovyalis caffra]
MDVDWFHVKLWLEGQKQDTAQITDSDAYFISVSVDFCMPTINSSTNEEKEEDPTWIGLWPLLDPIKE